MKKQLFVYDKESGRIQPLLSALDEFAKAALTGMSCGYLENVAGPALLAEAAYDIAEAMQDESIRRHTERTTL